MTEVRKQIFWTFLLIIFCLFVSVRGVWASENPLEQKNNKFGIHIIDESELPDASALVNSNGGEWGYTTIVIREDERDTTRWQRVFDEMRRKKVIPIVRLATRTEPAGWKKPLLEDAEGWALFLNSLNWPVKNRYVILFNEPNHAKEWGGRISPDGYAKLASTFSESLKKASGDFFVLPAGLDASAPNSNETMSIKKFIEEMFSEDTDLFQSFDGWVSHSYPNPGFAGSPDASGLGTIRSYIEELNILASYGVETDGLPVFITETGWEISKVNTPKVIAEKYKVAFESAFNDKRIVAVTPFLLNYSTPPFNLFSWKDPVTGEYYPQYSEIQKFEKVRGEPTQVSDFKIVSEPLPSSLVRDSVYNFKIIMKNTGQSIWYPEEKYSLEVNGIKAQIGSLEYLEPNQDISIPLNVSTFGALENNKVEIILKKDKTELVSHPLANFEVVPPPSLVLIAKLWTDAQPNKSGVTLNVYEDGDLKKQYTNLVISKGVIQITEVHDLVPSRVYEYELRAPYFAPKKYRAKLSLNENRIYFGRLLPIDLNNDGKVSFGDMVYYYYNPLELEWLLF